MQDNFEQHIREKLLGISEWPTEAIWPKIEEELSEDKMFEHALNQKIESYSVNISNEKIWNNLSKELQKKHKKRMLIWFICIVSGVSASMFGLLYQSSESSFKSTVKPVSSNKYSNATIQSPTSSESPLLKLAEKNEPVKQKLSIENDIATSVLQVHKQNKIDNAVFTRTIAETSAKQMNTTETTHLSTLVSHEPRGVNPSNTSNNSIDSIGSITETKEKPVDKEIHTIEELPLTTKKDSVGNLVYTNGTKYSKQTDKKAGNWSVIVGLGFSYTGMQLFSNTNDGNLTALAVRKQIEKPAFDWNASILMAYKITNKWRIAAGLNISNFKQQINCDKETAKGPIVHQQNANAYLFVNDTIFNGNRYSVENKYTFNEIPIWFNYTIKESEKIALDIQFGYSLGLLYTVNAFLVDQSGVGFLIANKASSFPRLNTAHFLNLAPGMAFKLNNQNELGFQLNFKTAINSIVSENKWVQQRPYAIGLELRYRRTF